MSEVFSLCSSPRSRWFLILLVASVASCSDSGTDPDGLDAVPDMPDDMPDMEAFMRNYVEAIFLGMGPLIPQDNFTACSTGRGQWAGFPRGTTVSVIASSTLEIDTKQLIEAARTTITEATLGEIQTEFVVTNDPDPMPGLNEATGTDHPSPQDTGCAFDRGCVHIGFTAPESGIMTSSRTTLRESGQPPDAFVHDIIGHGIMGMCHIDQALIGGNSRSLMAGGPGAFTGFIPDQLSTLDIAAARAVYGSSLNPGASRAEFVAAGLINP